MRRTTFATAIVATAAAVVALLVSTGAPAGAQERRIPPVVDLEMSADGQAYWVLDGTGEVHALRGAAALGSAEGQLLAGERAVSMSATPDGAGYWVFTDRGRALPFGSAGEIGDVSDLPLNAPIIDSVATPSGRGYLLVAADGGVFALGDATFWGSTGGMRLNQPVNGIMPTGTGQGYWLVADDGGVFSFGDAEFKGSTGSLVLNLPMVGGIAYLDGYLLVAADGGIFDFSDGAFLGSLGGQPLPALATAVGAADDASAYLIALRDGQVYEFTAERAATGDLTGRRIETVPLGGSASIGEYAGSYRWIEPSEVSAGADQHVHDLDVLAPIPGTSAWTGRLETTRPVTGPDGPSLESSTVEVQLEPADDAIEVSFIRYERGAVVTYTPGEVLFLLSGPARAPVTNVVGLTTDVAVPATGRYFERTFDALRSGDQGTRVDDLQDLLNDFIGLSDVGLDVIAEDGVFGPATQTAVETFERYAGRVDDAVVGNGDLDALRSVVAELERQSPVSVISTGDTGRSVEVWQVRLNTWIDLTGVDVAPVAVDGVFGPSTTRATIQFEERSGAQVDGIVEPDDRVTIRSIIAEVRDEAEVSVAFGGDRIDVAVACAPVAMRLVITTVAGTVIDVSDRASGPAVWVTDGGVTRSATSVAVTDYLDTTTYDAVVPARSGQEPGPERVFITVVGDPPSCG